MYGGGDPWWKLPETGINLTSEFGGRGTRETSTGDMYNILSGPGWRFLKIQLLDSQIFW